MNRQLSYRPDVDGLRTIAVVPVVLFHAGLGFPGGFVGVDVFFVISGFLITTILQREIEAGEFSLLGFYERRARRILPALFAVIAACLVAGWFLMLPDAYEKLAESTVSSLLFVSNMWFWQNSGGYFTDRTDYLPLLHTWSLAVEEQFYILFPLILAGLNWLGRRSVLPVLLLLVAGSFALAAWATPRMPGASFYLIVTRAWELGFGSLIALGALPARLGTVPREGFALLGLAGIVVPIFAYSGTTTFPGLAALPVVAGTAVLLWTGGTGPTLVTRLLSLRPMVAIGLISYSLYLWHWPVMAFARVRLFSVELPVNWQVGTVALSFLLAWASWRFVERPFRKPARAGGPSRAAIFISSLAGIIGISVISLAIVVTKGAFIRFPADQRQLITKINIDDPRAEECFSARSINKLCVFGSKSPDVQPSWILWGDSHAKAILPAIEQLALKENRKLLFASAPACAPLLGIHRDRGSLDKERKCEEFQTSVSKMIKQRPELKHVFIAVRWPVYLEGTKFPNEEPGPIILTRLGDPPFKKLDPVRNQRMVQDALIKEIYMLKQAGRKITLIGNAPEVRWNVPKHIERNLIAGTPIPLPPSPEAVAQRQASTDRILSKVAARTGATFIPMSAKICQDGCRVRDGLISYYKDDDHLNVTGARTLALPILADALENPHQNSAP